MTRSSLLLPILLLAAAAVAAPDPVVPPNPPCDDTCLLKLIRYSEEVNVDWLMAVPFCSSFLLNPAERRTRVQLVQVATLPPPNDLTTTSTTTITSTLTTTSTGFISEPTALESNTDTDTSIPPLLRRDQAYLAICSDYWAHYKPRPLPWQGHPAEYLRQACYRLLHRAPVLALSDAAAVEKVVSVVVPASEPTELVSVTVYKTIMTEVVVDSSLSTSTVTITSTRTRTVTVFEEEGPVPFAAEPTDGVV